MFIERDVVTNHFLHFSLKDGVRGTNQDIQAEPGDLPPSLLSADAGSKPF